MRLLLVSSGLLLGAALAAAAADPDPEVQPRPGPERKAMDKLMGVIYARDAEAVQHAYEQIAKDFPGKDVVDEAAWNYARFHIWEERLDKAQDVLLSLKRSGRKNGWVSLALIGLADIARERGDERVMIGHLEEALKAKAVPTGRNLMDTLDSRQEALIRLAHHYRDKGDFNKALDYYTLWEPQSSCGTCWLEMRKERSQEITLCRLRLGDHAGLSRSILLDLQDGGISGFDARVLCRLYSDAGQLDDLRRLLDAYDTTRKRGPDENGEPGRVLRELVSIESLAQKKDAAALVALCLDVREGRQSSSQYQTDPVHSAAAEALAALDGVEAVRSALAENLLTTWLVYALARSNSPAALRALAELAEQQRKHLDKSMADDIAYALALKGEPGKKVLKQLAGEGENSELGRSAQFWLERQAKPTWPEATWPRPKVGSLPKTLPEPS
jgi:hypothetical protein